MRTPRKRRRGPGLSLLAGLLDKNVRTIHRWIVGRPELRLVLRARYQGKQWRIDYPESPDEFDTWLEQIRPAVASFTRAPERTSEWARGVREDLGFSGEERDRNHRERDIQILRHALLLKRSDARQHVAPHETEQFHSQLDGERSANLPVNEFAEWES